MTFTYNTDVNDLNGWLPFGWTFTASEWGGIFGGLSALSCCCCSIIKRKCRKRKERRKKKKRKGTQAERAKRARPFEHPQGQPLGIFELHAIDWRRVA